MRFLTTMFLTLVPFIFVVAGMSILVLLVYLWRRKENKKRRHSPLTQDMLRSPGLSLRKDIEDVNLNIDACAVMLAIIPVSIYALHISQSYFLKEPETALRFAISVSLALGSFSCLGKKLIGSLNQRKNLLLGLEGELATGQELDQLMLVGYRVFHDVPTRWGNIDHVIVGQGGVFTVETKMRQKPSDKDRKAEVEVDYGQELLKFPDSVERKVFEQARLQQKWLSEWLRNWMPPDDKVTPTIALPGWNVSRTGGRWSVPVFNSRNPQKFFAQISESPLSDKVVKQIADRLDELCRDVEPSFGERLEERRQPA